MREWICTGAMLLLDVAVASYGYRAIVKNKWGF